MFWPFSREEKRNIFCYWDGARKRRVDPLVAYRALKAHPTFIWEEHPHLAIAHADQAALDICIAASRRAFDLAPLCDAGGKLTGVTDVDAFAVLLAFDGYLESLKKNTSLTPISPASTASPPSDGSPTKSASESGSTPAAPPAGEPST